MNEVVIVQEDFTGLSLAYLPIKAANICRIDVCDYVLHQFPNMQAKTLLTLLSYLLSKWGREDFALTFVNKGNLYCDYV